MVRTLELPEQADAPTEAAMETEAENNVPAENEPEQKPADAKPAPAELTQEDRIAVYQRKEQKLREANAELNRLEDEQAALRKEVNGYKKPIADARAKVERLISCDIAGFLNWEKEENPPTLFDSQAWRELPVDKLDVTEKDKEHIAEHFTTCGELVDWLCLDFPPKKPGISGEKTKGRLRDAVNKISGVEKQIQSELQNSELNNESDNKKEDSEDE